MPIHKPIEATPENLRTLAGEIARCAADLTAISDAASEGGFSDLMVTGYGQLRDAAKFTNNFVAAARNALWKARESRGDFGVVPVEERNGHPRGKKPGRSRRKKSVSE